MGWLAVLAGLLVVGLVVASVAIAGRGGRSGGRVERSAAIHTALKALGVHRRSGAEIVFGLRSPVAPGTVVRDGGPAKPGSAARATHSSTRVVATAKGRSWFFYEDLAPFQQYAHTGRVVLVDASSGRVTVSKRLSWPPTLNGRLPVFLASQTAYLGSRYRVFYRPYVGAKVLANRASARMSAPGARLVPRPLDATGGAQVAGLLASEHACVVRFSDTMRGGYYAFAHIAQSRAALAFRFSQLADFASGFRSFIYSRTSGVSPTAFVSDLISSHGCKDLMLYMAGGGYPGAGAVNIGMGINVDDPLHQDVSAAALRGLAGANAGVDFELVLDAPYTGAFQSLEAIKNVLLVASPVAPGGGSFTYLPDALVGGRVIANDTNPLHILQLTDRLAYGLDRVIDNPAEVAQLEALNKAGKLPSVLAYILARGFALGGPVDFVARTGVGSAPRIRFHGFAAGPPSSGGGGGAGGGGTPPPATPVVSAHADSYQATNNAVLTENAAAGVLANDTDSANHPLSVDRLNGSIVLTETSVKGAAVTLSADGSFAYDPTGSSTLAAIPRGQITTDTFTYRVSDGQGGNDTGTVTITVTGENRAPVAGDVRITGLPEDGSKTVGLSADDAEGDSVTFSVASAPSHGTLGSITGTSCSGAPSHCTANVLYTPDANYNGSDSFTYKAADGFGGSGLATVSITVDPVNDAPVAQDASVSLLEDGSKAIDLSALASDVETSDANLTYTIVSGPVHGGLSGPGENPTYTPNANFNGSDSFTYKVTDRGDPDNCSGGPPACDAAQSSATKTVSITIAPVNDAPVAQDKGVSLAEDGSTPIDLSALVSDVETSNANLAISIQTAPRHGSYTAGVYTPDPNYNGTDSFKYTVTDRGDPDNCGALSTSCAAPQSATGTVSITVDPVNDTPAASDGSVSLNEDTSKVIDLGALVSDVETSDANLTYTIVSAPSHGELSSPGQNPTYTPDANHNGADSFTYKVTDRGDPDGCNGGAPACDAPLSSATRTISLTVNPVNDTPVAAPASLSVDEDHALAIDLSALASDVETSDANLTYTIVSAPAHGTLTGTGGSRTYTPNPNYNGADSITYRVADRGDPDNCGAVGPGCTAPQTSNDATISISVAAVNDPPVNTVPAGPVMAVQDTNTAISGLSVADVDAGTDNVQVSFGVDHGTITLNSLVAGGLTPLEITGNGTATVTATATLTEIDATLAHLPDGLVYHSTPASYLGPDTLKMTSNDLGHNGSGGAQTDTDTVALDVVPPNNPPVASAQSASTNEDTAKTITLSASDTDGPQDLTFAIATPPAHGALGSIGSVICDHGSPNTCHADVSYTPAANYNGADSFTFTANDGQATSTPATVSITVAPVNDPPALQNIEGAALAYTENDPATQITATTTVSDVDSSNFDTGTMTVDYSTGGTVDDRLAIANQGTGAGQIGVSGANVTFAGATIGTFAGGSGTTPLVVTLNANADPTATQALVRAITYSNVSDNPSTAARTVRFVLSDGDGGTSAPATRAIALTAVNDPPTLAGIEATAVNYVESVDSAPSQSQVTNNLTITDPDNTNLAGATVQITTACHPSEDVLVFNNQNGITGTYTAATCLLTLTGSSSLANYQTALRTVQYETTSDTPNTTTRTVTFQVDDGQSANHASNTQTRDVTVTAANDSPTAVADTFNGTNSALAGVTLAVSTSPSTPNVSVAGNLLSNDTDPDTLHANLTAVAGTSSTQGGVVAVNSDGTFSYTPAPGFTDTDTFTYTVHDNGSPDRTATATVTINVVGPRVWFVNPGGPGGGNGTSLSPLNSIAPLSTGGTSDSLDGNGDVIFVYQGTGNATSGGLVLEANQRLVGQPQGLSVTNANGTYNLVTAGGANPTITNTSGAGVTLADGNTIQRVDVTGASGVGVTGTGINTLTYGANTTISGNAGGGIALSGAAGGAISMGSDITTTAGHSVSIANRTSGTTSLSGAVSDTGTGISLSSNTGATVSFTGTLNASTGADDALTATGGGTVNVNTGATRTLTTTTGTALTLNGVGGAIDLTDLAKNGAGTGISLTAASASVTIPSGATIVGTTTAGVTIDQGTGAFSYAGTISNSSGRAVQVTNRNTGSPGLVQFTGPIASTGGTGVSLDNNDNGTIAFSGGLALSTGANAAFSATNGGTVNVDNTDVVNTLTTSTGTALNVANTTIGSTGLNFQSISAGAGTAAGSGPANGIVLNNTGSSGGLIVTGDGTTTSVGGNSTGGTISNATGADGTTAGAGVYLNSTSNVVLRRMTINGTNQSYGIRGNSVNGFTLEYSTVSGTNGTAASLPAPENYGEGAIFFGNATTNGTTGAVTLTNNNISGGRARDFSLVNTSPGTTNLTVKGNTIGSMQNFTDGNQCFAVEARVSSGVIINTTFGGTNAGEGNTVNNCVSDNVNFTGQNNTTMDVVFRNNALSNTNPSNIIGGGNLVLATKGTMTYHVTGNTMRDANGSAVTLFKASADSGTPSLSGYFANNTIGVAGVTDSGSKTGNGIFLSAGGTGTMSSTIANNQIHQIHGNAHIYADNTGGSYTANFTITGNTLDGAQPPNWFAGIAVTNGSPTSSDTVNVCAKIGGSTAAEKNTLNLGGNLGIIVGSSGAASGHTFNLPGLSTSTEAGVESFLSNNNTSSPAGGFTTNAYTDAPATFAAFTGTGTSCPTPSS